MGEALAPGVPVGIAAGSIIGVGADNAGTGEPCDGAPLVVDPHADINSEVAIKAS